MKNIFQLSLFLIAYSSFSQDQLFKKDNTKLEVKILEMNQNEVKYKLFTYQDGPIIILAKSEVALIIYQNGVHEVITTKPEPTVVNPPNQKQNIISTKDDIETFKLEDFKNLVSTKHLISINIMEPLNGTFSLNYLHEFANNNANIYIPVSVGFAEPYMNQSSVNAFYTQNQNGISNFRFNRKNFEIGLGIHLQTSGKRAVTHFIGPYFAIAQYTGTFNENVYQNINGVYTQPQQIQHSFILNRTYVMLNNGFLFRAAKNFNIILNAAFGIKQDSYATNNPSQYYINNGYNYSSAGNFPITAFKLGLSFGYRF